MPISNFSSAFKIILGGIPLGKKLTFIKIKEKNSIRNIKTIILIKKIFKYFYLFILYTSIMIDDIKIN